LCWQERNITPFPFLGANCESQGRDQFLIEEETDELIRVFLSSNMAVIPNCRVPRMAEKKLAQLRLRQWGHLAQRS